jgi:hypothetical protein
MLKSLTRAGFGSVKCQGTPRGLGHPTLLACTIYVPLWLCIGSWDVVGDKVEREGGRGGGVEGGGGDGEMGNRARDRDVEDGWMVRR